MKIPTTNDEIIFLIGISVLASGLLLIASYLFESWFESYRHIKNTLIDFIGPTTLPMAFYLAGVSAFGEELLFRAAIQPFAGLIVTSILFGLLHIGPDGKLSTWTAWALLAGLLLGWIFQETGSLWPSIITHFSVNLISIIVLQNAFKKRQKSLPIEEILDKPAFSLETKDTEEKEDKKKHD